MIVATLDLGTNTCLLLIAEMQSGRLVRVLHDEAQVVRLGQGVNQNKRFAAEALQRARTCFANFAKHIAEHKAEKILAYATSATRDAENREDLFAIGREFGIPIQVISGEKEAECTFRGTVSGSKRVAVIDVGGGSTELIVGTASSGIEFRQSVNVGSVRLTEMFISKHPIPTSEVDEARRFVETQVATLRAHLAKQEFDISEVVLVAGTPTTLICVDQAKEFDESWVNGCEFPTARIQTLFDHLRKMSIEERNELSGMEPKRADVLPMGALCLLAFCELLNAKMPVVSTRGLRYGILYEV